MEKNSFIWSYDFFFYTWVKHFRKEGTLGDIAPFAAACAASFMIGIIYLIVMLIQMGNCYPNYLVVSLFPEGYDWLNGRSYLILSIALNVLYFKWGKRYQQIEAKFDNLPLKSKTVGHRISWGCFYFIFVFFLGTCWWFPVDAYLSCSEIP